MNSKIDKKPDIYYAPIDKILQKYISCAACFGRAKHQYGKRNVNGEGYDIHLLCDEHYREMFMKVNGLGEKDMVDDITSTNCL